MGSLIASWASGSIDGDREVVLAINDVLECAAASVCKERGMSRSVIGLSGVRGCR
jgi:hypothetical protein